MAHWQLGNKENSRELFDQSVTWIEEHGPTDEDLLRIGAEARELLELP